MNASPENDLDRVALSVIVPCYNEANHLMSMAEALAPYLDSIVGMSQWEFLIVSNGCTDDTVEVVSKIVERWPLTLLRRLEKPDYGMALREGLNNARGKWAFLINVDFWDYVFLGWVWRHRDLYDLFIGSKRADPNLDNRPKYRKILSWGLNVLLQIYFGLVPTDTHGQKLLSMASMRPILDRCVMARGQFDTEFTLRAQRIGLRIAELPVPIVEERKQRNLMLKKITQNFIDIFRLKQTMKRVPVSAGIHYHRYSRHDMESHENVSPLVEQNYKSEVLDQI